MSDTLTSSTRKGDENEDHNNSDDDEFFDWYFSNENEPMDIVNYQQEILDTGQAEETSINAQLEKIESPQTSPILNNQHCTKIALFEKNKENIDDFENSSDLPSRANSSARKRKVNLSPKARYLKNHFYLIFTNRKKFPKNLVKRIHEFIEKPLQLKRFSRKMTRSHDYYFKENAENCDKILQYLVNNKQTILNLIPEIMDYQ